jgi:hypothetical protein
MIFTLNIRRLFAILGVLIPVERQAARLDEPAFP